MLCFGLEDLSCDAVFSGRQMRNISVPSAGDVNFCHPGEVVCARFSAVKLSSKYFISRDLKVTDKLLIRRYLEII